MDKFTKLTGVAAPMPIVNIDTDMIIPKDYLKTIKRTGLGKGLFAEMRFKDGTVRSATVLDSVGTPARPMSVAQIRDKASGLISQVDPGFSLDALADSIWSIASTGSWSEMAKLVMRAPDGSEARIQ